MMKCFYDHANEEKGTIVTAQFSILTAKKDVKVIGTIGNSFMELKGIKEDGVHVQDWVLKSPQFIAYDKI